MSNQRETTHEAVTSVLVSHTETMKLAAELRFSLAHQHYHLELRKAQVEQEAIDALCASNPGLDPDKALGANDAARTRRLTLLLHDDELFRDLFLDTESQRADLRKLEALSAVEAKLLDFMLADANHPPNNTELDDRITSLEWELSELSISFDTEVEKRVEEATKPLNEEIATLQHHLDISNTVCAEAGIDLGGHF